MACGRLWDASKRMAVLDAAARDLRWPVCIAGALQGPDGSTFRAGAALPLGPLEPGALAARLRRAAIFAHPACYEPFGLAVLEAGQAGCALVLSELPELRESWDGAAAFVPPDDADALHAALAALIGDEDRRRRLAVAAKRRAATFTPARMARAYVSAYRAIASGPRAAA
jgi:glycosyltransferase involved in cell wall biosynthesis